MKTKKFQMTCRVRNNERFNDQVSHYKRKFWQQFMEDMERELVIEQGEPFNDLGFEYVDTKFSLDLTKFGDEAAAEILREQLEALRIKMEYQKHAMNSLKEKMDKLKARKWWQILFGIE